MSDNVIPQEQMAAFLRDLTELARRHNLFIAGCGCCNSPYLVRPVDPSIAFYTVGNVKASGSLVELFDPNWLRAMHLEIEP